MEEIVMTLKVRGGHLPYHTDIVSEQIYNSSKMLTSITGINVQPNKAIVGENAFAHEAGIHQDGVLKHQQTYEIMTPESVGIPTNKLVLGKHSGRHAFKDRLDVLGVKLSAAELEEAFAAFKDLADKKKNVYDEDIMTLVESQAGVTQVKYLLKDVSVNAGSGQDSNAKITLEIDGSEKVQEAQGVGPVDALFKALREAVNFTGTLERFAVNAITGGTDAQGEVVVTLVDEGKKVRGNGSHMDILVAAGQAYTQALNRLEFYQSKQKGV